MFQGLLVVVAGLLAPGEAPAPPARVGQIFIVGNKVTPGVIIVDREFPSLSPGQILSFVNLCAARRNLSWLHLVGVGSTVEVLDPDGQSEFKDIVVKVQEIPVLTYLLVGLPDAIVSRLFGR